MLLEMSHIADIASFVGSDVFVNDSNNPQFEAFRDIIGYLRVSGFAPVYVKDLLRINGFDEKKKKIVIIVDENEEVEQHLIVTIESEEYRFKRYTLKVELAPNY